MNVLENFFPFLDGTHGQSIPQNCNSPVQQPSVLNPSSVQGYGSVPIRLPPSKKQAQAFQTNLPQLQTQTIDLQRLYQNTSIGSLRFPLSNVDFYPGVLQIGIGGSQNLPQPQPKLISQHPIYTSQEDEEETESTFVTDESPPLWMSRKRKCWCQPDNPCKYCVDHSQGGNRFHRACAFRPESMKKSKKLQQVALTKEKKKEVKLKEDLKLKSDTPIHEKPTTMTTITKQSNKPQLGKTNPSQSTQSARNKSTPSHPVPDDPPSYLSDKPEDFEVVAKRLDPSEIMKSLTRRIPQSRNRTPRTTTLPQAPSPQINTIQDIVDLLNRSKKVNSDDQKS